MLRINSKPTEPRKCPVTFNNKIHLQRVPSSCTARRSCSFRQDKSRKKQKTTLPPHLLLKNQKSKQTPKTRNHQNMVVIFTPVVVTLPPRSRWQWSALVARRWIADNEMTQARRFISRFICTLSSVNENRLTVDDTTGF